MPYEIPDTEIRTFRLERLDEKYEIPEEEKTTVDIALAANRETAERSRLFKDIVQEQTGEGTRTILTYLPWELIHKEIYLTLVGCNMTRNGKPLFTFKVREDKRPYLNMNYPEFQRVIGSLADEIVLEIHEKVIEQNPHWAFSQDDLSLGER